MFGRSIGLIISRLVQWEFRFDPGLYQEGYSGVVLKTWSVKVVVTVRSRDGSPPNPAPPLLVVLHGGTASRMS